MKLERNPIWLALGGLSLVGSLAVLAYGFYRWLVLDEMSTMPFMLFWLGVLLVGIGFLAIPPVRKVQWLVMHATADLLVLLKWLHISVLHYNWFLIILLAWTGFLILFFCLQQRYLPLESETGES